MGYWCPNAQHESFIDLYNTHHLIIADESSNLIIDDHATHVAGTLIGDESNSAAKGMAWGAFLRAWDSENDLSEVSYAVSHADTYTPYLTISNHSYGVKLGWTKGLRNDTSNWYWTGDEIFYEDDRFGEYDSTAENLDWIALTAPNYLMVRAVGNDRGKGPIEWQDSYYYWDVDSNSWVQTFYMGQHPKDGGDDGYGCIPNDAVAKNILAVGAVDDIPNSYSTPSDVQQNHTKFSAWGPTKDGRIKPDIVANGDALYSSVYHNPDNYNQTGDNYYDFKNGTSMASPNACGSILLLQEYYLRTHSNNYPLSTTLKALVINSANEAGVSEGPDFKYGWGLLNTAEAADIISQDASEDVNIQELSIDNGQTVQFDVYSDGTLPIKATIAWNDPIPTSSQSDILCHDLDLRIVDENGTVYYPFVLDPNNPDSPATYGDDNKNNVEKVVINNPNFGKYTVKITSKGNYSQQFSVVISNVTSQPANMKLTIKQFFENGTTEIDSIARYENGNFINYPSGHIFTDVSAQIPVTLRATLKRITDTENDIEKFHDWDRNQKFINHYSFNLTKADNTINSYLGKINEATIEILAENIINNKDSVNFKDPWLRDSSDTKGTLNRGLDAIWHQYFSPYAVTISGEHQGVFLEQGWPNWQPPYYSVKAESPQIVNINGRDHKFYFDHWDASPEGSATFKEAYNIETPVVFHSDGATVKALMKGTQLTNDPKAFAQNNQNKVLQTEDGSLFMTYTSLGEGWLEKSTDGGKNWDIIIYDGWDEFSPMLTIDNSDKNKFYLLDIYDNHIEYRKGDSHSTSLSSETSVPGTNGIASVEVTFTFHS